MNVCTTAQELCEQSQVRTHSLSRRGRGKATSLAQPELPYREFAVKAKAVEAYINNVFNNKSMPNATLIDRKTEGTFVEYMIRLWKLSDGNEQLACVRFFEYQSLLGHAPTLAAALLNLSCLPEEHPIPKQVDIADHDHIKKALKVFPDAIYQAYNNYPDTANKLVYRCNNIADFTLSWWETRTGIRK